jgi:hypothetical protein
MQSAMSKHEKLNIFGGRSGEGKKILSRFVDEFEKREGTKWDQDSGLSLPCSGVTRIWNSKSLPTNIYAQMERALEMRSIALMTLLSVPSLLLSPFSPDQLSAIGTGIQSPAFDYVVVKLLYRGPRKFWWGGQGTDPASFIYRFNTLSLIDNHGKLPSTVLPAATIKKIETAVISFRQPSSIAFLYSFPKMLSLIA